MTMNITSTDSLMTTMTALIAADSLAPRISSSAHRQIRMTAGRLRMPGSSSKGACGQRLRDLEPEEVVQQLVQVLAPADGDGRGGDAVLQQQAGGDAHRHNLTERRIGIGIGGSGDRDARGQFGVTDGGQAGRDTGDDERNDDGRARFGHRLGQHKEDAGADGGADAEHGQLEGADGAFELGAVLDPGPRMVDRLAPEELGGEAGGTGSCRAHGQLPGLRPLPRAGRAAVTRIAEIDHGQCRLVKRIERLNHSRYLTGRAGQLTCSNWAAAITRSNHGRWHGPNRRHWSVKVPANVGLPARLTGDRSDPGRSRYRSRPDDERPTAPVTRDTRSAPRRAAARNSCAQCPRPRHRSLTCGK